MQETWNKIFKLEAAVSACVTNIILGPYQQTPISKKLGFRDQPGSFLTSDINNNADTFVDAVGRRQIRFQVNGILSAPIGRK